MLTVTETAKDFLKGLIDQSDLDPGMTLRLVVGPGGVGLAPDSPGEDDKEFKEAGGQTVLIVAHDLGDKLSEVTMDVQDTEEGPKLSIG